MVLTVCICISLADTPKGLFVKKKKHSHETEVEEMQKILRRQSGEELEGEENIWKWEENFHKHNLTNSQHHDAPYWQEATTFTPDTKPGLSLRLFLPNDADWPANNNQVALAFRADSFLFGPLIFLSQKQTTFRVLGRAPASGAGPDARDRRPGERLRF